jgi:hypothetical protein
VPATTGISASVSKLHTNQTQLRNDRPGVDLDFSEHKNKVIISKKSQTLKWIKKSVFMLCNLII